MRKTVKLLAVIVALLILAAITSMAQDPNTPDTVYVDSVKTPTSTGIVPVRFKNDEPLLGIEVTLKHNANPSVIVLDSVSFAGSRVEYLSTRYLTIHPLDTAFTITAFALSEPYIPIGSGLFCRLHFSFSGALDSTLVTIDSTSVIFDGKTLTVSFSDTLAHAFKPQFRRGYLYINSSICCIGNKGNVNGDINDQVTILDLTYMIDRLFRGGPPAPCPEEANLDNDPNNNMTILDLTFLIDRIFRGGPPPGPCP